MAYVTTLVHNAREAFAALLGRHGRVGRMSTGTSGTPRFLTLADVAELLNTSQAQVYALVRRGELPAIKLGGRGQWRVEATRLEDYIDALYKETQAFVADHPFAESESEAVGTADDR